MSSTRSAWTFRPVLRPIHFAGRTLFRVPVPLYVCEAHFSELPDDPASLTLPLEADRRARGAYVRSQPVAHDLPRLARCGELLRYVPQHYDRTLIKKRGSFADYLGKFGAKERYNIKSAVKKFRATAGANCVRTFRTVADVGAFLAAVARIAPLTYQDRLYHNQLDDTPFWRERLTAAATANRFRGYILSRNDRPIVFWLCTQIGDLLLSEYTGYDPAERSSAPGSVLLYCVLEALFGDGATNVFDFGEGDAFYKKRYGTDTQRCAEVFYLRPSVRNVELLAVDTAANLARAALAPVDRLLTRRGWRAKIKRWLRRAPDAASLAAGGEAQSPGLHPPRTERTD